MPIKFRCPHCRRKLEISSKKAGVKLACPACEKSIRVPTLDDINAKLKENQEHKQELTPQANEPQQEKPSTSTSSNTPAPNKLTKPPLTPPRLSKTKSTTDDDFSYEESQPLPVSQIKGQVEPPAESFNPTPNLTFSENEVDEPDSQQDELWNDLLSDDHNSKKTAPEDYQNFFNDQPATGPDTQLDELFDDVQLDNKFSQPANPIGKSHQYTQDYEKHHEQLLPDLDSELALHSKLEASAESETEQQKNTAAKNKKFIIPTTPRNWVLTNEDEEGYSKKTIPPQEDMDLTPMVDVTFLLLIFFMLTASFSIQKSIPVPKPDPKGKGAVQSVTLEDLEKDSILIEITAENKIIVDEIELSSPDDLSIQIIKASNNGEKIEVVIQPDPSALHEYTVKVIDAANEAGMQKIRLADVTES